MTISWKEVSPYSGQPVEEDAPTNFGGQGSGVAMPPDALMKKKKKQSLLDARTKAYRQHRERLEKARLKRVEAQQTRGKFVENIVSNMSEMSYGAGSMGAIRPQADMKNIQSKKSPLQKLKDFDKVRAGLGKKPIFKPS